MSFFIVKKAIRELAKRSGDIRVSEEYLRGLNGKVIELVQESVSRAKKNRRKTLKLQDL